MSMRTVGVMTMALVFLLVLACGGDDDTPVPASTSAAATATSVPAATATTVPTPMTKRGPEGTLNVIEVMGSEQWVLRTESSLHPLMAMGDPLMWWDWDLDGPSSEAILEGWSFTRNPDDSLDWTFNIRKGVKFHKGWGEVTAEDVKFTFEEMMQPGSVNSYAIYFIDFFGRDPANLVVKDPYTLMINQPVQLAAQYRMFYVFGPTEARHLRPFSKKYFQEVGEESFGEEPIFAGPYEFASHEFGYSLSLRAVPDHYRVTPGFAELNYFKVLEEATKVAMLRTGQIDISAIGLRSLKEIGGISTVVLEKVGGGGFPFGGLFPEGGYPCDPTVPWVQGCTTEDMTSEKAIKVRKALTLAVDRQAIIDKLWFGMGIPGTHSFASTTPEAAWWNPEWTPLPYDLALAKQYLADAGYPECFEFNVYINNTVPNAVELGTAAIGAWEQDLGCKVNQRAGEYLPFRSMLMARDTINWLYVPSAGGQASPRTPYMYACLHAGPVKQVIVWTTFTPYTTICAELESTQDQKRWIDLNRELGEYDYKTHSSAVTIRTHLVFAVGPKVAEGSWKPMPDRTNLSLLEFAQPQ